MLRFLHTFFTLAALILGFSGLHAQTIQRCGADEQLAWEIQNNPRRAILLEETEALMKTQMEVDASGPESVVQIIPVVFHVMWYDQSDNISQAQIQDALDILNEDMRRMNPDT
ncbi:MAG TPA: hypothetical protein DDY62_05425, partial [Cryomorphaceae bacterium]|nr:hypothetical protein [Cryomorphaceae bacterium]